MDNPRRVVITGMGVISPFGSSKDTLFQALKAGQSGVKSIESLPTKHLPSPYMAEASCFTGDIENFGPLEREKKKQIRKGLKAMCREMQMGLAAAQLALVDGNVNLESLDRDRFGVVFGCDHILTPPQEFAEGVEACRDSDGRFDFSQWAVKGLPKVEPLWLLKYLPNLPGCYVGIFNDLRGPNNSITLREPSSGLAIGEAYETIVRGNADRMIAGATGTRVHLIRSAHTLLQEQVATGNDPAKMSRPFDSNRNGMVLGEGAGAFILEELEAAKARGATILAEIVGHGSSCVGEKCGAANRRRATKNAIAMALRKAGWSADKIGHISAHGLSTTSCDADEAAGFNDALGAVTQKIPLVAPKANFGNLGAGGGMVETAASVMALRAESLFPVLNYDTPDPACPVFASHGGSVSAGKTFLKVNLSAQGQASALAIAAYSA